jgi:ABC-type transport system involved in multi-copper enzyme maturation permease subunit
MTSAVTTSRRTLAGGSVPGFGGILAAEWIKLSSLRSVRIIFVLGILLSVGMSALVTAVVGATYDDWTPAQQADFEPIVFSIAGIFVALILFPVMAVNSVSSEYSSGMARVTFTVTPARWRVLLAKAAVVAGVTFVGGTLAILGMFFIGQAIFDGYGMGSASLGDGDAQRAIAGLCVTFPLFPVLGVALGFLFRSAVGGITSVMALIWAPEIFGPLLPAWWQENVISLLPGPASDSISIAHLGDSRWYSDPAAGALIVLAWVVGGLAVAGYFLHRRDA